MNRFVVNALRVVLALMFLGLLLGQVVIFPSLAADVASQVPEYAFLRWPVLVLVVLGLACVQVIVVAIGRLLAMAADGTVFSRAAFRDVGVVVWAALAGAGLAAIAFVVLGIAGALHPSAMLATVGAGLAALGVALLMAVMRALLVRAVQLDAETAALHAELEEVI